jgi:hypothetical protein
MIKLEMKISCKCYFKFEYFGEFKTKIRNILGGSSASQVGCFVQTSLKQKKSLCQCSVYPCDAVRDGHGGGWSRKINAWHLYTLMVYL